MGRKRKGVVWCPFPDCFQCPHPDCIKDQIFQPIPKPGEKPAAGNKRLQKKQKSYAELTEEQKAAQRASKAKWRKNNPEKIAASKRNYYQKNREKISDYKRQWYISKKQKEWRDNGQKHLPDGQTGQRSDPGTSG